MKPLALAAVATGLVVLAGTTPAAGDTWTNYANIGPDLLAYETAYPTLCKRYDLGQSVQGRTLWAVRISDNVLTEEDEPEFKYISTMHGDEIVGVKMCMNLVDYLLTNYGTDPQATNIVDEVELWIVPLMNPDGYVAVSRYNASGVDLNRDFPDYGEPDSTAGRAPETAIIMNWDAQHTFIASANFHGGALVANYPYDNYNPGTNIAPDNDVFIWISKEYSSRNLPMWNNPSFPPYGVTNGADWYVINGSMQDWNYLFRGCNEVTIELDNDKTPPASWILQLWDDNRPALMAYIETCQVGVRGLVTDATTGLPLAATITVAGRNHGVYTDPDVGDYHRMLLSGTYNLTFDAAGYTSMTLNDVVVNPGPAGRLDIPMGAPVQIAAPNGGEDLPVGIVTTVSWAGSPVHPFQVQSTSNSGQFNPVTDDFESGSLGPAYATGGDVGWSVFPGVFHSPTQAARAGPIANNQQSWLTRTVSGGDVSFWYRVSSESGWDWFNFYIDGVRDIHASGTGGSWTFYSTTLSSGSHGLKWEYVKDQSQSGGSDTVWLDDLQLLEDASNWTDIVALTTTGASSAPWTPATASPNHKVRVRTYYGSGMYSAWDESDAVFTVSDAGCLAGDADEDAALTVAGDVPVFIDLLLGTIGGNTYQQCAADINGDLVINGDDLQGFVGLFLP